MNEEKKFIRIHLNDVNENNLEKLFDIQRKDEYKTTVDAGYEDLDLREDAMKIQLYFQSDIIEFNNGRKYRVLAKRFQPCRPVTLTIDVEEIK